MVTKGESDLGADSQGKLGENTLYSYPSAEDEALVVVTCTWFVFRFTSSSIQGSVGKHGSLSTYKHTNICIHACV